MGPQIVISVADLSSEMSKHVEPAHSAKLHFLLVALHAGLSLENFCRRVRRELGVEVLGRTMRGLFDLAQRSVAKNDERTALQLAKRRWCERLEARGTGEPFAKRRCV